ncbi:hypothetical protein MMC34_000135 [Xylographa carneopallida]|nr:hypothetical protein [Xylographa carneopallida]
MAAQFATLALNGINPLIQNYDTIYDKSKKTVRKIRIPGKKGQPDEYVDEVGYKSMDDYKYSSPRTGNQDRRKGRDQSGPRSAQPAYGYQDSYDNRRDRRPRSGGREPQSAGATRSGRRDKTPRGAQRYESSSESETSIPPRDRRRRSTVGHQDRNTALAGAAAGAGAYGAARAYDGRDTQEDRIAKYTPSQSSTQDKPRGEANGDTEKDRKKGDDRKDEKKRDNNSDSDSGSSSSSVLSSSEDERQHKHIRTKELLTAGLAAVATIHAASGVYSSMEARDKRYEQLRSGKISPEDARKEKTKAMLQDFAAVGVAALSIKGAMSKWQGAAAQHKTRKQHKKEKEERHQKRLEKRSSVKGSSNKSIEQSPPPASNRKPGNNRPGYNRTYSTSEPDLSRRYYDNSYDNYPQTARGPPKYQDANPYSPYGRR